MINRVFLRGDCHGDFTWLKTWCDKEETTINDILIILGDAGINFWLNNTDKKKKRKLAKMPITLFCIQGNHEKRPEEGMLNYHKVYKKEIHGYVWIENEYPNLWFAINGEYKIKDKTFLVADGAYSVDMNYRKSRGIPWFEDEQMSDEDMFMLFKLCEKRKYFDFLLTHAAPLNYEPTYLFLPFLEQTMIDKHTEWIIQEIYHKARFGHHFFGHYHDDNWDYYDIPRMSILYNEIRRIL